MLRSEGQKKYLDTFEKFLCQPPLSSLERSVRPTNTGVVKGLIPTLGIDPSSCGNSSSSSRRVAPHAYCFSLLSLERFLATDSHWFRILLSNSFVDFHKYYVANFAKDFKSVQRPSLSGPLSYLPPAVSAHCTEWQFS